jgi:Zn-dependent peptidase ImmA (M78 family)/transcriptional regulator with XRE-family HTH domain
MIQESSNTFGNRLKLARKMAGMSLQDLSNELGSVVTKQALNKYELGEMNPSSEILVAIAKVLHVKQDYFLKQHEIKLDKIEFRKRAGLSKKNEESIIEKARDYVERYLEIENILGIKNEFKNPLESDVISIEEDVFKAAEKLRKAWGLGTAPISNLVELLELKGIRVILIKDVDEVDGLAAITSSGVPVVVVNTKDRSIERIRFTIIHEAAHVLLKFTASVLANKKILEELCHYFSSCFLLPQEMLINMLNGSKRGYVYINELINIKEYAGISIRAIVHRCRKIGIITDSYYQRWMVYMSKTFGAKEEPGHYQGMEKSTVLEQLVSRALAEGVISISKAAALCNMNINEIRKGFAGVS